MKLLKVEKRQRQKLDIQVMSLHSLFPKETEKSWKRGVKSNTTQRAKSTQQHKNDRYLQLQHNKEKDGSITGIFFKLRR